MRPHVRSMSLLSVLLVALALAGCIVVKEDGTGCYWMENVSGGYSWVSTSLDFQSCYAQDSCDGGLGESGGGCYKWADCSDCERYPWPGQEGYVEPVDTSEPADTADTGSGA